MDVFNLLHLVTVLGVCEISIFEVQSQHQQIPLCAIILQMSSIPHRMPSVITYSQVFPLMRKQLEQLLLDLLGHSKHSEFVGHIQKVIEHHK